MNILIKLFLFFVVSGYAIAQNFVPLAIGNKYIFKEDFQDQCAPWNNEIRYHQFTISDSVVFNGETYYRFKLGGVWSKYLMYDSAEQKLYVYNASQKSLAADFNALTGQHFASFLYGSGWTYRSSGRDTVNLYGTDRVVWGMSHDSVSGNNLDYASFMFADDIGMYYFLDGNFCDPYVEEVYSSTYTIFSAIIKNRVYNPLELSAELITPVYDRRISEFPLDIEISVDSDLPELIDSMYLYYEVKRDSVLIFHHQVGFNPTYLTARINLDSTILQVGDKVNFRIVVSDSTIFENRVSIPNSGYYTINILSDSSIFKLYPLAVGNKWIYDGVFWDQAENYTYTFIREVDSLILMPNQHFYYRISEYQPAATTVEILYERVDSISGNVYRFDADSIQTGYEYLIDDLTAGTGDTILSYRFFTNEPYTIIDVGDTTVFQIPSYFKTYDSNFLVEYQYKLATDFGLISVYNYFDFGSDIKLLRGAVINNTVYGDTTATAIKDKPEKLTEYHLWQNYPNPFNPVTTIEYSIPNNISTKGRQPLVTLRVYDVLGREVATLVNEEMSSGNYLVQFDGSRLSSGVYYYKMKAGDFSATKKLILLK